MASEPEQEAVGSRQNALIAAVVGIALTAVSFLPALAGGRQEWTKEKALEYQQASNQIQALTHELGRQTPDVASKKTSEEFQQSLDHFQDLQSQLKTARGRSGGLAIGLRLLGLALTIVGGVYYFAAKRRPVK